VNAVKEMYAKVISLFDGTANTDVNTMKVNKVDVKELCVGNICVTEDQLQRLLQNQNITPAKVIDTNPTIENIDNSTSTPITIEDDNISTSTPVAVDDNVATSTNITIDEIKIPEEIPALEVTSSVLEEIIEAEIIEEVKI
jgi:hypothetical protein